MVEQSTAATRSLSQEIAELAALVGAFQIRRPSAAEPPEATLDAAA
jgi:hypothetical protein